MIRIRTEQFHRRAFGSCTDRVERALLEERYRILRGQLPITFGIFLANVLGLYVAAAPSRSFFSSPAWLLSAVVFLRGGSLLIKRRQLRTAIEIQGEFKRSLVVAFLYSLVFCHWALELFEGGGPNEQSYVVLFATLASIGCAYGLAAFPLGARIPLIFLGVPISIELLLSPTIVHIGMGVSLLLMVLLTHRLLGVHNDGFKELVKSRVQISDERLRAHIDAQSAREEHAIANRIAHTDALTGLTNRRGLLTHLERLSKPATAYGRWVGLILVDLDGFKPINDTFGHGTGDLILIEVSERLQSCAPESIACRLGGDEFALLAQVDSCEQAGEIGESVRASLSQAYVIEGRELRLSACCGVLAERGQFSSPSLALSRSDMALYKAKGSGRNCVVLFSGEMETRRVRRTAIERALRTPSVQEQIGLAFQPIFNLRTMKPAGCEALARWRHPDEGEISASEFIGIAEQIDVIEELGQRLLDKAATQAALWDPAIKLAFNLSGIQLSSDAYAAELLAIASSRGLTPDRLQIEVTETALLADFEAARRSLAVFRGAGADIVLDDFGAGYASVAYLRELEFDAVKLDGSLLDAALSSAAGERLMRGVLHLCTSLAVPCVAEHIQTAEALELVLRLGCHMGQGFYLSPPKDAA